MTTKIELYNFVLRLADDNLILAQRLAEWCSCGPILEEDLAMTNISLDLLGQAEDFYEYASELNGEKSEDELAFLRSEREYYNHLLVEQPNGDFACTMLRQMLYSTYAKFLYEALLNSRDEKLVALATKGLKEVKYHFRHSSEWIIRFGKGTKESNERTKNALVELWRFTSDLFEMNETDKVLITSGISFSLRDIYPLWKAEISNVLEEAGLEIPNSENNIIGGINGIHTEYLGHLLSEMQFLQRAYPGAKW
ncbi:MAG: phenylacetate-CoA oxygenase subunit PaaC [bacterium]|nr:phenylacetate-CoA oxygenase subunit PaaC [bacterium]